MGFLGGLDGKESTAMRETWVQSLGWEDPLEEGLATHSSILAWRIPRPEEPLARQAPLSMGFSQQEYWNGLPFPPPGDLPGPEIKLVSVAAPALASSLSLRHLGSPVLYNRSLLTVYFICGSVYILIPIYPFPLINPQFIPASFPLW